MRRSEPPMNGNILGWLPCLKLPTGNEFFLCSLLDAFVSTKVCPLRPADEQETRLKYLAAAAIADYGGT